MVITVVIEMLKLSEFDIFDLMNKLVCYYSKPTYSFNQKYNNQSPMPIPIYYIVP